MPTTTDCAGTNKQHRAGKNLGELVAYLNELDRNKSATRFNGDCAKSMVEPVSGTTILF